MQPEAYQFKWSPEADFLHERKVRNLNAKMWRDHKLYYDELLRPITHILYIELTASQRTQAPALLP